MDSDGSALVDYLTDEVLERDRPGWKRVVITPDIYDEMLGRLEKYPQAYVGGQHITIPSEKRRYIVFRDFPVTTGELARAYLRLAYDQSPWGGPPTIRVHHNHPYFKLRAPLLTIPTRHRSMAYVDLHHAYWAIVSRYRADMTLGRDGTFLPGVVDFPLAHEIDADRGLRHAVVGSMFSRQLVWWRYGEPVIAKVPGPFANPSLLRICMDTLHAVVTDVRRHFEVFAWLTDACLVPNRDAGAVQDFLMDRWGLSSGIKGAGMGAVWSPSTYRVGEKVSLDIVNGNATYKEVEIRQVRRMNVTRLREWRAEAPG